MSKHTYGQFCIFLLGLFLLAPAWAQEQPYHSVDDLLAKQKTIRVCMSTGPNFGDQANALNIINHLRDMGFKGTFEIIYDKEVMKTITTLFGLPETIPAIYSEANKHYIFMELNDYKARALTQAPPLIDFSFTVGKAEIPCEFDDMFAQTFVNFSSYFDSTGKTKQTIITTKQHPNGIFQPNSGNKYLVFPETTYAQAKNFLYTDPIGKKILAEKVALPAFLTGMENKSFNILPVYGRTLKYEIKGNLSIFTSPSNMLQTIAGARYAQLMGPRSLQKPLIIAIYYDYQSMADRLLNLITKDHFGDDEERDSAYIRLAVQQLNLVQALSSGDIRDSATIDKINHLQPGQILLLSMGNFPKNVFDGIYTHTAANIWPQVREGAGSFSSLAVTGKPSLECAITLYQSDEEPASYSWTAGFDLITDPNLRNTLQRFYHSREGYCGSSYYRDQNEPYETNHYTLPWKLKIYALLGELIIMAHDPHSSLNHYFQALKRDAQNPKHDRVRYALKEVLNIVNRHSAS